MRCDTGPANGSIDKAGLAVIDLLTLGMDVVFLAVDDTLLPRCVLKIFSTGMHRDLPERHRARSV
ncbi:MAG: hypothetical protein ACK5Q5_05835 [Planctomycetaceae bacterium]